MDHGPVELLVVIFDGNRFTGDIVPALADLREQELLRVLDVVFFTKDADGNVAAFELNDLDDEIGVAFSTVVDVVAGLATEEDIEDVADALEPETSAAIFVVEHLWARRVSAAIRGSGGELAASFYIPHDVVDAAIAAAGA